MYGEKGNNWLENIDRIIKKYEKLFDLKNIKLLENMSINVVLSAKSDKYGDVIIKIGTPGKTALDEIRYINMFQIKNMVNCYYYNLEDRVMILEKVLPGYTLERINNIDDRIEVFVNLLNEISNKATNNLEKFPTYEDKLKEKIIKIQNIDNSKYNITEMANIAVELYEKIKNMNLPKYVLHEDLQHKNILKSENGWKIIDPHGVVGEKVFETCQFIRAEIYKEKEKIDVIVNQVAKKLKIESELIYKALYIDLTTKLIFYIGSGYPEDFILENIILSNKILEHIYF
mgnify:CR=1 FL=1